MLRRQAARRIITSRLQHDEFRLAKVLNENLKAILIVCLSIGDKLKVEVYQFQKAIALP
jgi:hypothetical protein